MPVYTYTTIDDPLGTSVAFGINDAGQVVGGYSDATNHEHGFLYSGGTFTTLALSADTLAYGINDAGQIVGDYFDGSASHGFLYSGGTFTTLDDPCGTGTSAHGINAAGQIVGTYLDANGRNQGFLLDPNRGVFPPYFNIEYPSARETFAYGINDSG